MATYLALVHKDPDSDFGVSFPDFPGCVSAGATLEEAGVLASQALVLHIEGMLENGDVLPAPSSLDEVTELAEAHDASILVVDFEEKADRPGDSGSTPALSSACASSSRSRAGSC